jgi:hypothetical protein
MTAATKLAEELSERANHREIEQARPAAAISGRKRRKQNDVPGPVK